MSCVLVCCFLFVLDGLALEESGFHSSSSLHPQSHKVEVSWTLLFVLQSVPAAHPVSAPTVCAVTALQSVSTGLLPAPTALLSAQIAVLFPYRLQLPCRPHQLSESWLPTFQDIFVDFQISFHFVGSPAPLQESKFD